MKFLNQVNLQWKRLTEAERHCQFHMVCACLLVAWDSVSYTITSPTAANFCLIKGITYLGQDIKATFFSFLPFFLSLSLSFLLWGAGCGMRDPSSPTRDGTRAPCIRRAESQPLDHQEVPRVNFLSDQVKREVTFVSLLTIITFD